LNEVGLDAKEDFITLVLGCWTSKNGYAFLGNIIVSYISAQLFLNMSFCMLHADCDHCYNWTGRIGLIKIVWGPKVKSFQVPHLVYFQAFTKPMNRELGQRSSALLEETKFFHSSFGVLQRPDLSKKFVKTINLTLSFKQERLLHYKRERSLL